MEIWCTRCGHFWDSRIEAPARCPHCHSPNYDQPVGQLIKPTEKYRAIENTWHGPTSRTKGGRFQ